MAPGRRFEFELYRLNIADAEGDLFSQDQRTMSGDDDAILEILRVAAAPEYSYETATPRARHQWDVRDFTDYTSDTNSSRIVGITLARSTVEELSDVVTDMGIERGTSQSVPPRADHIDLFFYMQRHLVAVERFTPLTQTSRWREALHDILEQASRHQGYRGRVELEPVPRKEEIMAAFRSFERLTRLRVRLRIPNPELSRDAEALYREMEDGGVRTYLADMRNSRGLNKGEGRLPHAAAEIAQAGYKHGTVSLEGVRNGKFDRAATGGKAARGIPLALRSYVRGMHATAKAKETQKALDSILREIDRIAPPPERGKADSE